LIPYATLFRSDYGLNLGLAFQIADDVLDYTADSGDLGKNLGDDLAEGKATLPLIHAMAHSGAEVQARLRQIVEHGDSGAMPEVLAAIGASGGIGYSQRRALHFAGLAQRSLAGLPEGEWLGALRGLARYAGSRNHRPYAGPAPRRPALRPRQPTAGA